VLCNYLSGSKGADIYVETCYTIFRYNYIIHIYVREVTLNLQKRYFNDRDYLIRRLCSLNAAPKKKGVRTGHPFFIFNN